MKKFLAFLMAMAMLLTCAAAVAESTAAVTVMTASSRLLWQFMLVLG